MIWTVVAFFSAIWLLCMSVSLTLSGAIHCLLIPAFAGTAIALLRRRSERARRINPSR